MRYAFIQERNNQRPMWTLSTDFFFPLLFSLTQWYRSPPLPASSPREASLTDGQQVSHPDAAASWSQSEILTSSPRTAHDADWNSRHRENTWPPARQGQRSESSQHQNYRHHQQQLLMDPKSPRYSATAESSALCTSGNDYNNNYRHPARPILMGDRQPSLVLPALGVRTSAPADLVHAHNLYQDHRSSNSPVPIDTLTSPTQQPNEPWRHRPAWASHSPASSSSSSGNDHQHSLNIFHHSYASHHHHDHHDLSSYDSPSVHSYRNQVALAAAARRRGNLPRETTEILRRWYIKHALHPYPTDEEKRELIEQTGLQAREFP